MKRRKNNKIQSLGRTEWFVDSYANAEQERHPRFRHRKCKFNQRTGQPRQFVPNDEAFTRDGRIPNPNTTSACLKCRKLGRSTYACPHCGEPMQGFGFRFRFPKKHRWQKHPFLKKLLTSTP